MSDSLSIMCVGGDAPEVFERVLAQEVLGRDALDPEDALENRVDYPDGSGGEVICDGGEDVRYISFLRFGGEMFFDRIWELAHRADAIIYWDAPGWSMAVTSQDLVNRLLPEFREGKHTPIIVRSGKELSDAYEESFPPIRDDRIQN